MSTPHIFLLLGPLICHFDEEKVAAEVVLVEGGRVAVVFTTRVVNGVVGRPPDRL